MIKYYEVYDANKNTLIYDESKKVSRFDDMGELYLIQKRIDDTGFNSVYDIYSKATNAIIYENVKGLSRIENTSQYLKLNKKNQGNKYDIIDKNGKTIIEEFYIPFYIQYNSKNDIFELTKKRNGKAEECYDKNGIKINCQ